MAESLRDQLEANLDTIVTRKEDEIGSTPAASPSGATGEPPQSKIGTDRPRDETGKFKPVDKSVEKAVDKALDKVVEKTQPATTTAAPKKAPQRPSSWKKDYWGHWEKLTSGGQLTPEEASALAEYMGQRETDFQHGVSTYKREWEQVQPLVKAMEPFVPLLSQHRIDPSTWISNLGNAHKALVFGAPAQKLQMMAKLAADYGVPLAALTDPNVQQQYLASAGIIGQQMQQPQALTREEALQLWHQQFAQHASDQEVAQFVTQKDKFPYVEEVRETMAQLLESGLANDLPSAYEAALKLPKHSDIWQEVQKQEQARSEEERRRAEAGRTNRARGKALSPRSATPNAQSEEKPRDRRSQIADAFEAVTGAGRV